MKRLSEAVMARVHAAREAGIPTKVILRALGVAIEPDTMNLWVRRRRALPPCPRFREAFESLIREGK